MQRWPKDAGIMPYLLLIPWFYIYGYGIDPLIREWIGARMGVTFEVVRAGGFKTRYFVQIREQVGFWRKCKIWLVYGLIAVPILLVWTGIEIGLVYLLGKYVLRML